MRRVSAMWMRILSALLGAALLAGCVVAPGLSRGENPQVEVEVWREGRPLQPERWYYVEAQGARCANGSPVGVGVNAAGSSRDLLVYFNGGGACWDAMSCGILETAANTEIRYSSDQLGKEVHPLAEAGVLSRDEAINPLYQANFMFVPYCTGDLHAGYTQTTYPGLGLEGPVYHQGRRNVELFIERAKELFPDVERVWLMGVSAGGYAVTLNFELFNEAFEDARVHAYADASPWLTLEDERWEQWRTNWAMTLPAACEGCVENSELIPSRLASAYPDSRFALSVFSHDAVISTYFGAAPTRFAELLEEHLSSYYQEHPNMRVFVAEGGDHETLLQLRTLTGRDERRLESFYRAWVTGEVDDEQASE